MIAYYMHLFLSDYPKKYIYLSQVATVLNIHFPIRIKEHKRENRGHTVPVKSMNSLN
jgi:hypothetical protein